MSLPTYFFNLLVLEVLSFTGLKSFERLRERQDVQKYLLFGKTRRERKKEAGKGKTGASTGSQAGMGLASKADRTSEELRGRKDLPVWGQHSHDRLQSYDCIGEKHRIVLHI